MAILAFFKCF